MDDVPACPTSPEPRRPALSVVVPVRDGGDAFEACLRALRASCFKDYELIVIDDGSADGSWARAQRHNALVVRLEKPAGPASARNLGAKLARADVVFFLDADVALHTDSLAQCAQRFAANPDLSALFGSYDDDPADPGLISRFRNLLHHHFHQTGHFVDDARPAHTFWTGCGAIRREVFATLGGFDPLRYQRPAIEDIELGYRLHRAGFRIQLVRSIQCTHLKRWTLSGMVKTDIFHRGVPWTLLMLRSRVNEGDLNLGVGQKLCTLAVGASLASFPAAVVWPPALATIPLTLAAIVTTHRNFYSLLSKRAGWAFPLLAVWIHALHFLCCGIAAAIGIGLWLTWQPARAETLPATARTDLAHDTIRPPRSPARRRLAQWLRSRS